LAVELAVEMALVSAAKFSHLEDSEDNNRDRQMDHIWKEKRKRKEYSFSKFEVDGLLKKILSSSLATHP
jgi:hypothetical protein